MNMTSGADWAMTDAVAFSDRSETSSAIIFDLVERRLDGGREVGDALVGQVDGAEQVGRRAARRFSIFHRMASAFLVAAASAMMRSIGLRVLGGRLGQHVDAAALVGGGVLLGGVAPLVEGRRWPRAAMVKGRRKRMRLLNSGTTWDWCVFYTATGRRKEAKLRQGFREFC